MWLLARLQNHNATDNGNVDLRSFRKFYIQGVKKRYKVVDLLVQKILNDMTLDGGGGGGGSEDQGEHPRGLRTKALMRNLGTRLEYRQLVFVRTGKRLWK